MVTRMLNLLGVELGDESALLPPVDRDNVRGYWEPRWMNELNEEVLATLGSGTFEPFEPPPGWERSPQLEPLRERARALIAQHFGDATRWGWKDPRTSLTLPFWREVVDAPLRCVVCLRSPADAVASALRRGVVDLHRWTYAERWFDYTALALAHTEPAERLLVFYEDVLRDPAGEAARLAAFLDVGAPAPRLEEVVASIDPEQRHHVTSPWDVAVDPGLPLEVRLLYLLLRASRSLEQAPAPKPGAGALHEALERVGAELREARRERDRAEHEQRQTVVELERLQVALAELGEQRQADTRAHDAALAAYAGALAARDARIGELDAAIATYAGSRSWKLTRPLRAVGALVRTRR